MSGDKVIDAVLMARILSALENGKDNANDAYNAHMEKIGNRWKTKKDKHIEDCLKQDIDAAEELMSFLRNLNLRSL